MNVGRNIQGNYAAKLNAGFSQLSSCVPINMSENWNLDKFWINVTKEYPELCQTYGMELFAEIVRGFQPLTISLKSSIWDVSQVFDPFNFPVQWLYFVFFLEKNIINADNRVNASEMSQQASIYSNSTLPSAELRRRHCLVVFFYSFGKESCSSAFSVDWEQNLNLLGTAPFETNVTYWRNARYNSGSWC